ncbi:hypothetical protein IFT66_09770 [Rhizobium sp. CFBP 13726]|uniref:hypothetical protein n=1 Tax=Rhizobium sp. CFBP 13726 TaxID=2775296 RepID=UPI001782D3AE|nr:hypothetical protein [Rhizobium sp. CFBP 13726]MBD8651363.1 hypothetical protein [Rhizobium sp. CFBP 13726]
MNQKSIGAALAKTGFFLGIGNGARLSLGAAKFSPVFSQAILFTTPSDATLHIKDREGMESVMIGGGFSIFGIDLFGSTGQLAGDRKEEAEALPRLETQKVEETDADRLTDTDQQDIFLWSTSLAY